MPRSALDPTDKHVGARVRMRRLMLDMSQSQLGNALGLTFQQVQKYEKGSNRISASRLQHISQILQVPVPFFFEGAPAATGIRPSAGRTVGGADEQYIFWRRPGERWPGRNAVSQPSGHSPVHAFR